MVDIVALFQCLHPHVTATTVRQCSRIAWAMLVMTGRVTMLGISRWAGKGGSYRTVQRFFAQALPWAIVFWVFFRHHVYRPKDVYVLAGDEVVATKAVLYLSAADNLPVNFSVMGLDKAWKRMPEWTSLVSGRHIPRRSHDGTHPHHLGRR